MLLRSITGSPKDLRGLAGTILVYKVAAALSDKGADLDSVENIAKYVASRLGTLGVGLEHCHVSTYHITEEQKLIYRRSQELVLVTPTLEPTKLKLYVIPFAFASSAYSHIPLQSRAWVFTTKLALTSLT